MALANNNRTMVDRPMWEQLTSAPASSAAGSAFCDDNERYAYILFTATSFWRYDTWADTWQQLASPPGGTLAAGSCIRYVKQLGYQLNGKVYGVVFALLASGAAVSLYRFNTALNQWSVALSVANVPAAWATDGRLVCPEPALNGNLGGYHSNVALNTVTASSTATAGATTISVAALPLAMPTLAVLNFGTAAAPIYAVLTSPASAGATSIAVSPLIATVNSGSVAYWYADMFLFGNNATAMYRYNFSANAWTTTSANSGNPALPASAGAIGAGCIACWLPGSGDSNALNRIQIVRGGATADLYEYDLVANTFSAVTYYPFTETFTTGTSSAIRQDGNGKSAKLLIKKDTTGRVYEFDRYATTITPKATQNLISEGAALVGDKMFAMRSADGIEYVNILLSTSATLLRTGLFF